MDQPVRPVGVDPGHGLGEGVADPDAWPGLHSLMRAQAECNGPHGRQRAVRYYIASLPVDAKDLLTIVRDHWGIENGLHHTRDCSSERTTAACTGIMPPL